MKAKVQFSEWNLFCCLATEGSIAAGAKVFGCDPSNLKRRLDALEEKLRLQLFVRGRNGLSLTVAGRNLYARVHPLVEELFRIMERQRKPTEIEQVTRSYCIAIPIDCWRGASERALRRLRDQHPSIKCQVLLYEATDILLDTIKLDLTILASEGTLEHACYLGELRTVICATRTYLDREGMISSPEDMGRHTVLTTKLTGRSRIVLLKDEERFSVKVKQLAFSATTDAMLARLLASEGVALSLPETVFNEIAEDMQLVRVLPEYRPLEVPYVVRMSESAETDVVLRFLGRLLEEEWKGGGRDV